MAKNGYLKRYRNPIIVIRFAIILHIFLPSRIVSILLFLLFRASVSYKTVCGWTNKFADGMILPPYQCTSDVLICHVDENITCKSWRRMALLVEHKRLLWQS